YGRENRGFRIFSHDHGEHGDARRTLMQPKILRNLARIFPTFLERPLWSAQACLRLSGAEGTPHEQRRQQAAALQRAQWIIVLVAAMPPCESPCISVFSVVVRKKCIAGFQPAKGVLTQKGVVEAQMPARRRRYDFFSRPVSLW